MGGAAKRQIATNSGRTISSIKRYMGSDYRAHIDGKDLAPQEISAMILAKIRPRLLLRATVHLRVLKLIQVSNT